MFRHLHGGIRPAWLAVSLVLMSCGPVGPQSPIGQSSAISRGLAAVETLDRQRAIQTAMPKIVGFSPVVAYESSQTSSIHDSQGDHLAVEAAPHEAWIIEYSAPPQGIWGSVSALAEVDTTTGVVRAVGLWAIPYGGPTKT
jgi:hypothetical protein